MPCGKPGRLPTGSLKVPEWCRSVSGGAQGCLRQSLAFWRAERADKSRRSQPRGARSRSGRSRPARAFPRPGILDPAGWRLGPRRVGAAASPTGVRCHGATAPAKVHCATGMATRPEGHQKRQSALGLWESSTLHPGYPDLVWPRQCCAKCNTRWIPSAVTPGNIWMNSSALCPSARFSNRKRSGTSVSLKIQVPSRLCLAA